LNMNNKKTIAGIMVALGVVTAGFAASRTINFSSILPTAAKTTVLTDEQQGILAVRTAKASVVDIVGISPQASLQNNSSAIYGSGFIVSSDGLILSNNHVVADATLKYTVILADGSEYPAKVLGQDKFDDVALLQIAAKNLTPAKLGNSDNLETGQSVFAIGNSLGQYQFTVTRGVISALGRAVDEGNDSAAQLGNRLHNLIQTDAAINPGNSGGPLINMVGEVIGMNTLIDTSGESLGFAVPINTIKDAEQQLKTFGTVSRPFLGVQFIEIDPVVQVAQQLSVSNGALVGQTQPGSPAAAAGILPGDIITGINNITLSQNKFLDDALTSFSAGSQVTVQILRNGQVMQFPVVLGQLK
jgi:serine protease Do